MLIAGSEDIAYYFSDLSKNFLWQLVGHRILRPPRSIHVPAVSYSSGVCCQQLAGYEYQV